MLRTIITKLRPPYDITDLIFRGLFSLIFLALGAEHIFQDQLIQTMMPAWLPFKRLFSIGAGVVLLSGGFSVLLGYKTRQGAFFLGIFLISITIAIHGPALINIPDTLPKDWHWLWDLYQRSNFVKNLCLLGVCFHLINHKLGKYSLDIFLRDRRLAQSKEGS